MNRATTLAWLLILLSIAVSQPADQLARLAGTIALMAAC